MVFEAAAYAAPEGILPGTINFVRAGEQRQEIGYHSRFRVLLPEDMIIECTFVVVGNFGISCPAKQVATEFQHIVCTTSLTGISGQMFG